MCSTERPDVVRNEFLFRFTFWFLFSLLVIFFYNELFEHKCEVENPVNIIYTQKYEVTSLNLSQITPQERTKALKKIKPFWVPHFREQFLLLVSNERSFKSKIILFYNFFKNSWRSWYIWESMFKSLLLISLWDILTKCWWFNFIHYIIISI